MGQHYVHCHGHEGVRQPHRIKPTLAKRLPNSTAWGYPPVFWVRQEIWVGIIAVDMYI